jgi:hypothetical protein
VSVETPRAVITAALEGRPASLPPVALHWWGVWKYEALGLPFPDAAWQPGSALADVYGSFYDAFRPGWFHLHIGTPRWFEGASLQRIDGADRLVVDPRFRGLKAADRYFSAECGDAEEIIDFADYLLASRVHRPRVDLAHAEAIDEYVHRWVRMSAAEIEEQGYADHVAAVCARRGAEAFVAVHIPSAVCEIFDPYTGYVGFEQGLVAFHDEPEGMRRLIARCYEAQLEWAHAFARAGAHAFVISESYISPDIAHPSVYRGWLKGVHREYFAEIARMGLVPLCMFWGDVVPVIDDLAETGIRGLLVEESKKGFTLDIAELRRRAAGRFALFGNLDSITLLRHGAPGQVRAEVRRQAAGAGAGFLAANGSPVAPGTPPENVRALIDAGREMP